MKWKHLATVQLLLKQPINLCLIYNPPNSESSYHQKLLAYIYDIMQSTAEVILLGDFNAPGQLYMLAAIFLQTYVALFSSLTMFNNLTILHIFMVIFCTLSSQAQQTQSLTST